MRWKITGVVSEMKIGSIVLLDGTRTDYRAANACDGTQRQSRPETEI